MRFFSLSLALILLFSSGLAHADAKNQTLTNAQGIEEIAPEFFRQIEEALAGGILQKLPKDPAYQSNSGPEDAGEYPHCRTVDVPIKGDTRLCCKKPLNTPEPNQCILPNYSGDPTFEIKCAEYDYVEDECRTWRYVYSGINACSVIKKAGPPPHYYVSCFLLKVKMRYYFEQRDDGLYICARSKDTDQYRDEYPDMFDGDYLCSPIEDFDTDILPLLPGYPVAPDTTEEPHNTEPHNTEPHNTEPEVTEPEE